ncbi:MAG TPA: aminotransferase class IV, partial [Polyangiaceae bacterium]|nr:aminotransferase class IV [Polyangiaceae bacterium]
MTTLVLVDGTLFGPEDAKVSVFDRGFLFGDSVFETVRTYGGRPFRLTEHLERLQRSAGRVFIELPVDLQTLATEVQAVF